MAEKSQGEASSLPPALRGGLRGAVRDSNHDQQHKRWRTTRTNQERARELRREQTPAEASLWRHLRANQLAGLKFRRQHPIGRYIVDFYCASRKLIVELDGHSHAEQVDYDQARCAWLEEQGCQVIRFTNREVEESFPAVLERIAEACGKELGWGS